VHDKKSSSESNSAWNLGKYSINISFNYGQEYMHPGGSLEYQFAAASSMEMIRVLARVALSPLAKDMMTS
jgi:hypothetical protein